ncbi:MAG: hypothetical protein ACLFPQ_05620 [Candidatus Woesearchaeota archaeon]
MILTVVKTTFQLQKSIEIYDSSRSFLDYEDVAAYGIPKFEFLLRVFVSQSGLLSEDYFPKLVEKYYETQVKPIDQLKDTLDSLLNKLRLPEFAYMQPLVEDAKKKTSLSIILYEMMERDVFVMNIGVSLQVTRPEYDPDKRTFRFQGTIGNHYYKRRTLSNLFLNSLQIFHKFQQRIILNITYDG